MNIPTEPWKAALQAVITKATIDADFRAKCLSDPAAAVREVSGMEPPPELRFVENEDGSGIVLPPFGSDPDEITDGDLLSDVAGGGAWGYPSIGDRPGVACGA